METPAKQTSRWNARTKPEDRVPALEKYAYALGAVPLGTGMQVINRMANIVLNMGLGLSPALIGVAIFIFRMWDAFTDPVMGAISDNARWKWGRRRPYLVIGSVLCALVFPLVWLFGRGWSHQAIFAYFTASTLLFYTCFTFFSVPYLSLAAEMTPDYHERTHLISLRAFVNKLVAIGVGWLFALVTLDWFEDELEGMRWASLLVSLVFLVFGILPALFSRERFHKQAMQQRKTPLVASLRATLSAKPFLMLVSMVLLMVMATMMSNSLGLYLNVYYVCHADKAAAAQIEGWSATAGMAVSILSIPVFNLLSRRLGKTRALAIDLWLLLLASLAKWVLVNPAHPHGLVLSAVLQAPGLTGIWILLPSMQADVCDWDELNTGCRREGSYSSVFTWFNKTGLSISLLLANLILVVSGFEVELGAGQRATTMLWMRILYCLIPVAAVACILFVLRKYPLTEPRCRDIRAELERRRGVV